MCFSFPSRKVRGEMTNFIVLWELNELIYSMYSELCQVHSDHLINISYYCDCTEQFFQIDFLFFLYFINEKAEIIKIWIICPSSLSFEETKTRILSQAFWFQTHMFNSFLVIYAVQVTGWRTMLFSWVSPWPQSSLIF